MKKLKYYIPFFFLALVVILTFPGCKEELPVVPPPPPPVQKDSIVISIADVTHRSVSVSLRFSVVSHQSKTVKLFRVFNSTNSLVAELPGVITDTTIIDDDNGAGLLLDTTYSYYAVSIDSTGSVKDTSNTVTARTLTPTTHNYTWTEYTIGEWQSAFNDVWGTDENNVYACGTVIINDTAYGVLKWNGIEWLPHKRIGGVGALYGFSNSDLWAVGGAVEYWDGIKWTRIDASLNNGNVTVLDSILFYNNPYTSIWGTSSSNLYFGNAWGKIIHWDGSKAEVVYSSTDILLTDVYGYNSSFILAGGSALAPPSIVLKFDGIFWNRLTDLNSNKLVYSVYINTPMEYYVVGQEILRYRSGEWVNIIPANDIVMNKIRGNKITGEIVITGHYSTLYHFNGIDWQRFQFTLSEYTPLYSVFLTNQKIFAVGSFDNQARIIIGSKN